MTVTLCAIIVHTALVLTGPGASSPASSRAAENYTAKNYAEARRVTLETGRPLIVMVSTDWCSPCQTMKKTILPRVRQRGLFRKVIFAMVNPDRDSELAEQITGGGPIPQLVMFRKTSEGWVRRKLIGGQSVEAVEQFINDGLVSDEADKKIGDKSGRNTPSGEKISTHQADASPDDDSSQSG